MTKQINVGSKVRIIELYTEDAELGYKKGDIFITKKAGILGKGFYDKKDCYFHSSQLELVAPKGKLKDHTENKLVMIKPKVKQCKSECQHEWRQLETSGYFVPSYGGGNVHRFVFYCIHCPEISERLIH